MKKTKRFASAALALLLFAASPRAEAASQNDLNWWEWQIYLAVNEGRWNYAGDYANQKGAHYESAGDYASAVWYYSSSASYWTRYGKTDYAARNQAKADESQLKLDAQSLDWWEWQIYLAIRDGRWNYAGDYANQKGAYYEKTGNHPKAAHYFRLSADAWAKYGNKDYAESNAFKARQYESVIEIYAEAPAPAKASYAKFEPQSGAYLGMFPADKQSRYDIRSVESVWGKQHAIGLWYAPWGRPAYLESDFFVNRFASDAKKAGAAVQLGFEPLNGLDEVKDGDYIRQFAREAKASGVPVFLRYASEMNGDWVPWHGDPQTYVEKFRLVHDIMAQEAPNVAMVWSPNSVPADNIDAYYPGDAYVDWVGVSLYAAPFHDGKKDLGTDLIDNFKGFYAKYAHKPIMISETGVAQTDSATGESYASWALGQLEGLYGFLPKMFPQVKAITYFNMNKSESKGEVWDLGESPAIQSAYKRLIKSDYFLSSVAQGAQTKNNAVYAPLSSFRDPQGEKSAFAYVKLPLGAQPYCVGYWQGSRLLGVSYAAPWDASIDFSSLSKSEPITAIAFNSNFQRLVEKNFYINL